MMPAPLLFYCLFFSTLFLACTESGTVEASLPEVTAVYPTSDSLPENLLRMYVQFSQAMKTIGNLERIKLRNENGIEIKGAIFNNVYELWDKEQKQLTLIFDPARVKTGLNAHQSMGRALQPGENYQLIIDNLEDIHHRALAAPYIKNLYILEADTVAPNIESWTLQAPPAATRTPLLLSFPAMLDQLSLQHRLAIADDKKQVVKGSISIGKGEASWAFKPIHPWKTGPVRPVR